MKPRVLTLYRYRVVRTSSGRLFTFGYDIATADVRIVELVEFDEAALSGKAADGTTVTLDGRDALDMNAGAFWFRYVNEHGLGGCTDVTPMPNRAG